MTIFHGNFMRSLSSKKTIHAALFACIFFATINSTWAAEEDGKHEFTAAKWRSGDMIVSESAADSNGWLTLTCEGGGCKVLLDTIQANLPANECRRTDGQLKVRAQPWHKERLAHYGPFRAAEAFGGLTALQGFWLDARYTAAECRWTDDAGAHLIELVGGQTANYTGPNGTIQRLDLQKSIACSRCRALDYVRQTWRESGKPRANILALGHMSFRDTTRINGYANWPNKQPAAMSCTLR